MPQKANHRRTGRGKPSLPCETVERHIRDSVLDVALEWEALRSGLKCRKHKELEYEENWGRAGGWEWGIEGAGRREDDVAEKM